LEPDKVANRPSSRPSIRWNSHSGRCRSSSAPCSRPTGSSNSRPPGRGNAESRTWYSRSRSSCWSTLAVRAARLRGTRRKLGPRPQPISPGLTRAAELWESHSLVADRIQRALAERVSTLITYYEHLETLSQELAALDLLSGANIDDQLAELLAGTVGDQQAAQHLRDLTAEARASITAIHDVMQLLTHDLRTLEAADNIAPRNDQE
jgi:hypothetical protein